MYLYQNGDRCPCCGQEIQGKDRQWLLGFSHLCAERRLQPAPEVYRPGLRRTACKPPERTAEGEK